jgi:hypothetical protein
VIDHRSLLGLTYLLYNKIHKKISKAHTCMVRAEVGVVMGSKFYTINFKDQIIFGSSSISIHF